MALPPQTLSHGALEEQIGGLRWKLRQRDFDSCIYSVDSSNESFVVPGSALPSYPHMRAVEVSPEQVGDVWVFNGTEYKGFKSATETWRKFAHAEASPSEGFDNITMTLGTREPNHARFKRGATAPTKDDVAPEFPNMFIMDVAKEETDICDTNGTPFYHILNLQLRGLLGAKPYTRRVSGAAQTFVPDIDFTINDTINEAGETVNGFAADGDQPVEISISRLVITDSFVTLTEPPFGGIPGNVNPDDAPTYTDLDFWTTGAYRYHWPFGWRRAQINAEKLPGNFNKGTGSGYQLNGAKTTGATSITVDTGTGTILAGDIVRIGANKYTVATDLSGGTFTIPSPGLLANADDNLPIYVTKPSVWFWSVVYEFQQKILPD